MSNDYVLRVKTEKDIGTRKFASELLGSWVNEIDPGLRPEFFALGEPIRRSLEKEGVGAAVDLWVGRQMPVMLRRRTKPKLEASIDWRPIKGKDPRPFPWGCTVWLDRSAGDELALNLFRFLVGHFEPAFGSITTEEDSRTKHWITFEDRTGRSEQYMGLDVGRFVSIITDYGREVLPGVYWTTYFGPGAKRIVGERNLERLEADRVERLGDGYLVRAYPTVNVAGAEAAHQAEDKIMEQLGAEHFFEKSRVNIGSLMTDQVTAARVEKKIEQIKAGRA